MRRAPLRRSRVSARAPKKGRKSARKHTNARARTHTQRRDARTRQLSHSRQSRRLAAARAPRVQNANPRVMSEKDARRSALRGARSKPDAGRRRARNAHVVTRKDEVFIVVVRGARQKKAKQNQKQENTNEKKHDIVGEKRFWSLFSFTSTIRRTRRTE